jgi:hypothetical protein
MKSFRIRILFLSCVAAFASAVPTAAQGFDRPAKNNGPTMLKVRMVVLDIGNISSVEQTFTANIVLMVRWQDDRLIHEGLGDKVIPINSA